MTGHVERWRELAAESVADRVLRGVDRRGLVLGRHGLEEQARAVLVVVRERVVDLEVGIAAEVLLVQRCEVAIDGEPRLLARWQAQRMELHRDAGEQLGDVGLRQHLHRDGRLDRERLVGAVQEVNLRDELRVRRDLDRHAGRKALDLARQLRRLREEDTTGEARGRDIEVAVVAGERAVLARKDVVGDEEPVRVVKAGTGVQLDGVDVERLVVVQRDLHAQRRVLGPRADLEGAELVDGLRVVPWL